jgi:hypothetical protein
MPKVLILLHMDSASLVRGADRYRHFTLEPIPTVDFDPAVAAFFEQTTEAFKQRSDVIAPTASKPL